MQQNYAAVEIHFLLENEHLTFEREGEGDWVISEKNILQTNFEMEKFLQEIPGKKNPAMEKYIFYGVSWWKSYTVRSP